ncbi:MAG: hypothetical protein JW852_06955 [Spirochaetales bacterium]|nr:hypothetical protein [Spirochaetales bacterium]
MAVKNYLDTQPLHDIARYNTHADLEKEAVAFTAAPRKHPYDDKKILLVKDPFSSDTVFYEFNIADILHVDSMSNVGTDSGRNIRMARVWIKKGSLGLRYEPFEVDTPLKFLKDSEILKQTFST